MKNMITKKLQKEILTLIKNSNENPEKGIEYDLIKDDLLTLVGKYYMENIIQHLKLLREEKKIEVSNKFLSNSFYGQHNPGWARLTSKGYKEFDPWYKKFWNFFTNDMAKILSIIATIISIISMVIAF